MGEPCGVRPEEKRHPAALRRLWQAKRRFGSRFVPAPAHGRMNRLVRRCHSLYHAGLQQRILESVNSPEGSHQDHVHVAQPTGALLAHAVRFEECAHHIPTRGRHHTRAREPVNGASLSPKCYRLLANRFGTCSARQVVTAVVTARWRINKKPKCVFFDIFVNYLGHLKRPGRLEINATAHRSSAQDAYESEETALRFRNV